MPSIVNAHNAENGGAEFDKLPDDAYVRVKTVGALFGDVSDDTVWRWSRKGIIPAPEKIGPNVTAWKVGLLRKTLATA